MQLLKIRIFTGLVILLIFSHHAQSQHYIRLENPEQLQELFRWSPDRYPMVSAHRGGPAQGFPENCIETFDNTLRQTFAIIECDPQLTKDSVAVLMHDYKLERTTNGKGAVTDYTYAELSQLRLKDPQGNSTDFAIPTLDQVVKWAKNKTVLTIDIKKTITPQVIEKIIRQNNAEAYATVITYNLETAKTYHQLNPKLMISVTVRNKEDYERLAATGIPLKNVIAFTGTTEPDTALYRILHEQGVSCIVGTMGNLDRSHAARQTNVYGRIIKNGADILATDFPAEAAEAIKELMPARSEKAKFYVIAQPDAKAAKAQKQKPATKKKAAAEPAH